MLAVTLVEPQIAANAGAIIRLCAATGAELHLVEPLGFFLDDKKLKRAGLGYLEMAKVYRHLGWKEFTKKMAPRRLLVFSSQGKIRYDERRYEKGDVLVFGAETHGLAPGILEAFSEDNRLFIPMRPGVRCLNLAMAAAVALYEASRQAGFEGWTQRAFFEEKGREE